jgi:hypothetical protein
LVFKWFVFKDYTTSNLPLPPPAKVDGGDDVGGDDTNKQFGIIYDVQGDVTKPERAPGDQSPHVLILQIVDDGGKLKIKIEIHNICFEDILALVVCSPLCAI